MKFEETNKYFQPHPEIRKRGWSVGIFVFFCLVFFIQVSSKCFLFVCFLSQGNAYITCMPGPVRRWNYPVPLCLGNSSSYTFKWAGSQPEDDNAYKRKCICSIKQKLILFSFTFYLSALLIDSFNFSFLYFLFTPHLCFSCKILHNRSVPWKRHIVLGKATVLLWPRKREIKAVSWWLVDVGIINFFCFPR